jgi:hypothetical protein
VGKKGLPRAGRPRKRERETYAGASRRVAHRARARGRIARDSMERSGSEGRGAGSDGGGREGNVAGGGNGDSSDAVIVVD